MFKIDGYTVFSEIYESDSSRVYRGRRESDQKPVVLKVLKDDYPSPSDLTRYRQEYEITLRLNLEGVITVYELINYKRKLVIIFEDFSAISLAQLMHQKKQADDSLLDLSDSLHIAVDLARILGNIHAENIIHKDINPANIVINQEIGKLKVIDFGISTIFARENPILKSPQILEGTLAYISPEQTGRMNRSLDWRTDFYSLGVTFYELFTGQLPFTTTDALELVHCHIAKQPISPRDVNPTIPAALANIIMKLMAKTAEDRYQNAFAIAADLNQCLQYLTEQGTIPDFPVGEQDISDRFQVPQKLYGREQDIQTLIDTFQRSVSDPVASAEMLLVSGYSGIGKSSLIAEIHKINTRFRGYFIEGKFNQFQRSTPYSGLVSAFKGLIRQLLGESDEQLQQWRESLLSAMGNNGQVVIDVIPEVELIIGQQPPVPELGANESQNRFNLVFSNFVQAFCTQEHPLVLFLDDLQWADSATLKLLELIMIDTQIKHLFFLGAYRDNEVSVTHPLMMTLSDLQQQGVIVNSIHLSPLQLDHVVQLLSDTLYSSAPEVQPLAELVLKKTGGNPFFVNQFLKTLHDENLIVFNHENYDALLAHQPIKFWHWNLEDIEAQDITENVVDLVVRKLKKLPQSTQKILQLAACTGAGFSLDTLAVVSEKSKQEVFSDLVVAAQHDFILPTSELDEDLLVQEYKFLHDRVQQAAYSLIEDAQKKPIHLQIGRLLLANTPNSERASHIFEIVDHLNIAVDLIQANDSRVQLAQLNLEAGLKAKSAAAYKAAVEQYFNCGIEILSEAGWQQQYALTFKLFREKSECVYLCGHFEEAEVLFDYILAHAQSNLDRAEIQSIRLILYDNTGKFAEAIAISADTLQSFGIDLPIHNKEDISTAFSAELLHWQSQFRDMAVADLFNIPDIQNQEIEICLSLLSNITGPAYFANQDLLPLITLKMVNLSMEHGNSDTSAYGYALWGFLSGIILQDYKNGQEFGFLAIKLNEKFNNRNLECKVFNTFGGLVNPWRNHLREGIEFLRKGYLAGVETGDVFVSYNSYHLILQRILAGEDSDNILQECSHHLAFLDKVKNRTFYGVQQLYQHFILNLKDLTPSKFSLSSETFDEHACLQMWHNNGFVTGVPTYHVFRAQLLFLYGEYEQALESSKISDQTIVFLSGIPSQGEHYLFYALSLLALSADCNNLPDNHDEILQRSREKLRVWAENCPDNFLHKCLLVEAEVARVAGHDMEALDLYDRAIAAAHGHSYGQYEALGNELAAKFWLGKGKEDIAQMYMVKAYHSYQLWGAKRKLKDLEATYAHIFSLKPSATRGHSKSTRSIRVSSTTESGDTLDLSTFIKSSQAITSEIVLSQLLAQLIIILLENTGAQSGFLILTTGDELRIEAEAQADGSVTVLQSIPLSPEADDQLLSAAIVNYVARTLESVVLNDARSEGDFTTQAYIQDFQVKSVLCVPLVNQGQLRGVAYLENNLIVGAFTQERVEIVQLLSGEAAIAINNAQLYSQLRDREQQLQQFLEATKRFVPEQFLSLLNKQSIADVRIGDQVEREMSIVFADIRDFTSLSEQMTPAENFAFINEYLGYMEPQIQRHGGFVDKYIGDAIMALFPNSADDALQGAMAMLAALEEYNRARTARTLSPLRVGIGIHSGKLMLGTVGGIGRMDGTAIGDTVNIAARVESLTKAYGVSLLITNQTFFRLTQAEQYQFRFVERVMAKGKTQSVSLLEVFSADPPDLQAAKAASKGQFERGVVLFEEQAFAEAAAMFAECLQYHADDHVARYYLDRCQPYL